jgi:putative transcriptional regulator
VGLILGRCGGHTGHALMKNRLRALRAERGWSQADLGERAGVSRQAINAIETEKHDPSLDLAFRLASIFGTAVENLFDNPHARKNQSRTRS